ncbi:hypothetical protein [Companilactobacillus heilongjiangensis]|uniref:Lipoprotein n=1 Tax=Companilactobacillus heilongjiangensis TaxID=1074467 RepID=A0A0K2LDK1_9LACO|nr:hypothetical protein [Companilactobacillus heilongjiangensis]ALB29379.1 hypothetical protein JP39_08445 [Companilactobacillus heilongjiangensis]
MKKLSWLIVTLSLLLIAGCSAKNNDAKQQEQKLQQTIRKNQKVWNKQKKSAVNIDHKGYAPFISQVPTGYNDEDMTLSHFKNGSKLVVKAQVVNLEQEHPSLVTETKATIYIEKVISGDKAYQGRTIKTEFSGGLSTAKYQLTSIEGNYVGAKFGIENPKTSVYLSNPDIPMSNIGQRIIVGLNKFHPESEAEKKTYQKNGLTTKNFFVISNPEVTYWVQKNGKFKLNNPAFYKDENKHRYPNLNKITKSFNK